jgi:hypothetical protein
MPSKDEAGFAAMLRAKGHASQVALTMMARVQEQQLKKTANDEFSRLLNIIQQEEKRIKPMKVIEG